MTGFNPWIDVAVVGVCMTFIVVAWYLTAKHDSKQKAALRGATRNV